MNCFLTFDVGTTAMKCILFDESLSELYSVSIEYSLQTQEGGFVELDAEIYYNTFCRCVKELKASGIDINSVRSVTFTTQGETLIPVDRDGNALCPAIIWLDSRAKEEAEYLKSKITCKQFYEKTGLCEIEPLLPAAKILWIYNNRKDIYDKTYKFLLLEDYLILKLTGEFVSEKSLQSSSGWYEIKTEAFFDDMLNLCHIKKSHIPKIMSCGTKVAAVKPSVCEELGFCKDTYVVSGAMDQISSAIGIGNIREGMLTETTGTALVAGVTVENPDFDYKNPITVYKHYDGKFLYIPYIETAGMTLKWFNETVMPYAEMEGKKKNISSYEYIDELALKAPVGSGGIIMLPDLTDGGSFVGLSLSSTVGSMARSVLEGVAYMLEDIYSLGGGSKSKLWCSIKADVINKNIVRVGYAQTTSRGAAVLAAVADGIYKNVGEAVGRFRDENTAFIPKKENVEKYKEAYNKYQKVKEGIAK